MTDSSQCPTDTTLQALVTGLLEPDAAELVLSHLELCAGCAQRIDQVRSDEDSLFQLSLKRSEAPRGAAFQHAASRIRDPLLLDGSKAASESTPHRDGPGLRYVDRERHAAGGVGQVWRVRDEVIGREVALKELRDDREFQSHARDRFLNEARITAHLEHPGIVPVYDLGHDENGQPFYTMRFIRGRTLRDAARDFAKRRNAGDVDWMELRTLVSAVISVANSISYAHSRGVLHRDLKGDNILLGDFGEVLVLDWGLARMLESEPEEPGPQPNADTVSISAADNPVETEDGSVVGTPAFMAPEQAMARRDEMNERTDVYGIGAVLYQVLAGEPPFGSGDAREILRQVQRELPQPPSQHWPQVPRALQAICQKAMSRCQGDRYESPTDIADELNRWLADEPVLAIREPLPVRLARWGRKHRTVVTTAAALVITALIALATSNILISREQARTLAAQTRAERNFGWANDTVNSLIEQVSQSGLTETPAMSAFRLSALERAVRFNEQFLTDSNLPAVRLQAAQARDRVASLYSMMGRHAESVSASKQAAAVYAELIAKHPELPEVPLLLADCQQTLAGRLFDEKQLEPCLAACDRAEAAVAQARASEEQSAQLIQVRTLRLRGQVRISQGQLAEAQQQFALAKRMLAKRADDAAKEAAAHVEFELAELHGSTRDTAEALAAINRSVALLKEVGHSGSQGILAALGTSLVTQSRLLKETGNRADAEAVLAEAIGVHEKLVDLLPFVPDHRRALINAYSSLAILMAEAGNPDAETMFRNALSSSIELRDQFPATPETRMLVAASRRHVGICLLNRSSFAGARKHLAHAAEELDGLVADYPQVTDYRYRAATTLYNVAISERSLDEFHERSEQTMLDAISALQTLCDENPAVIPYSHRLGSAYRQMAQICIDRDDSAKATTYFHKAIGVHRRIAELASDKPLHYRQLGIALYKLGEYLHEEGEQESAQEHLAESLSMREKILEDQPEWFYARMDVVLAHMKLGEVYRARMDPDGAEKHFRAAVEACRPAIEQNLHGPGPSREYGETMEFIAQLRLDAGRYEDALEILKDPVAVFQRISAEAPAKGNYRYLLRSCLRDRAQAHVGLKQPDAASAAVDEMLAVLPIEEPDHHVAAAKVHVACAAIFEQDQGTGEEGREQRRANHLRQAAEQIKIAISLGYEDFEADDAFDTVRDLPEFESVRTSSRR